MKSSAYSGWDSFTPDAGTVESMKCRVCASEMEMHPNCQGPRSAISAMVGGKKEDYPLFDHFICPNSHQGWHQQARILLQESEKTPSRIIADVYTTEAKEIISMKNPTIPRFDDESE